MNLTPFAIGSQAAFYIYWLATEWVDFFPWNDIKSSDRKNQITGSVFHGTLMAFCMVAFAIHSKWLMLAAVAWISFLFAVEVCNWVIPYLFGIHLAELDRETYVKHFSRTYRFLPPIKDHNIIDAQHVVVILLTTTMWVFSAFTVFEVLF